MSTVNQGSQREGAVVLSLDLNNQSASETFDFLLLYRPLGILV